MPQPVDINLPRRKVTKLIRHALLYTHRNGVAHVSSVTLSDISIDPP